MVDVDDNKGEDQGGVKRETLFSLFLRKVMLPLIGIKRRMADHTRFQADVLRGRRQGDAPPPKRLLQKYDIQQQEIAGCTVYLVQPRPRAANASESGTLIYLHGGAYVVNMVAAQWRIVDELAERTGSRVVVPCYPLAPESDWQAAYAMLDTLYTQLLETAPADAIALVGDSAGGGLCLGLAMHWRDQGLPLPARLLLISPWLNLSRDNPRQAALEWQDPILARASLVWAAEQWANGTPLLDPRISPVAGSLRGLPPIMVFSGTADLLNADARDLVERAEREAVEIAYVEGHKMTHAWNFMPFSDGEKLYSRAAGFLAW